MALGHPSSTGAEEKLREKQRPFDFPRSEHARLVLLVSSALAILLVGLIARSCHRDWVLGPREIREFHESVSLGLTRSELKERFEARRYRTLDWKEYLTTVSVEAPYTFGADNWIVHVGFDRKSRVCSIFVYTADSSLINPTGSPDQISAGCTDDFRR